MFHDEKKTPTLNCMQKQCRLLEHGSPPAHSLGSWCVVVVFSQWPADRLRLNVVFVEVLSCLLCCIDLNTPTACLNTDRRTILHIKCSRPSTYIVFGHISRVPDPNVISQAGYIVEIYHSGPEPSICNSTLRSQFCIINVRNANLETSVSKTYYASYN